MITRESFKKIIVAIEKQDQFDSELGKKINSLIPDSVDGIFTIPLSSNIVQILGEEFRDSEETISWWLWDAPEAGRAKNPESYTIFGKNKKWIIKTVDDLYDYLLESYNTTKL
jgi:hypothetical protein